ncbi:hypothetical protein E1B28_003855 [Marasmius oreades]|uniref:Carboxylic ester hydrolase n=1 Tax=Marasmius oreades TaxID=181124 RepID=A0A9P7UXD6_9AGAR|nr:uncharacterized protein E1B28_003855 [Marasmius oreades]KAG7096415.1 hypothetical protein E1B28_003855 [Marasmius oreades]
MLFETKMLGRALAFYALTYAVVRSRTASATITGRPAQSVSLLFENDADWERFGDHASALLFHEPATIEDSKAICKENNETLFDIQNLPEIVNYLSYFHFTGDISQSERFWAASKGNTCITTPLVHSTCIKTSSSNAKHPFLCTNSAPHTTAVDTDFSSSPKTDVIANGAVFTGTRDHLTFRFMGIPYAQAPTGSLRFRHAQTWKGMSVDATALKPGCLQFGSFENNDLGLNPWGISEDCLYLNIYTPHIPPESRTEKSPKLKPVLLWIHGGANTGGLGSDLTFDGGPLVSRTDTVVVTINYRLNIFGFLSLNDGVITGNYALSDKIAALQWVKDNIAAFGGDPGQVTIFGQSAGGWSIIDLVRSPKAKGLFHGAISQSGGASTFSTAEQAASTVAPVLAQFCDGTGTERLECLQALPAETLLNVTRSTLPSWPSVQDGVYIVDSTVHQIGEGAGAVNSVPFLVGFMPDEGQSLLQMAIAPNDTDFNLTLTKGVGVSLAKDVLASGLWEITDTFTPYNATVNVAGNSFLTCPAEQMITAAARSSAFPALYVYVMRHGYALSFFDPYNLCTFPVGHPQPSYLCHSADLYEVFGTYHIFSQPVRVVKDIHYTALVQDLWGAFAKSGNPNPDKNYLRARGSAYKSTLIALESGDGWVWPQFTGKGNQELVASLDYPGLAIDGEMPDERNGRCAFLLQEDT